jgi:hypothetical protein
VNQIVFVVRTSHVPQLPFTLVIYEIGLVDTTVLPIFAGVERWFRLFLPLLAIPLKEADRVGSPKVLGAACVVNAFYPGIFVRIPAPYI